MSLRRFYMKIDMDEVIQQIFFVLNLFPVKEEECLVCYDNIETEQDNLICHRCNKIMHLTCIEKWFSENYRRQCPHCRTNWKFEIDIIDKPKPIIIELDEYSVIPHYNDYERNRTTVMGSITGQIRPVVSYGTALIYELYSINEYT